MFCHELFKPYKLSIEFLTTAMHLLDRIPRGNAHLKDQLRRASTSIPLNIAEGNGRRTLVDRLGFYSTARGSTMECAAICDVIALVEPKLAKDVEAAKGLLEEISRILTSIDKSR
jgi:four helix bundle protein